MDLNDRYRRKTLRYTRGIFFLLFFVFIIVPITYGVWWYAAVCKQDEELYYPDSKRTVWEMVINTRHDKMGEMETPETRKWKKDRAFEERSRKRKQKLLEKKIKELRASGPEGEKKAKKLIEFYRELEIERLKSGF